ncbi:MAG TPA: hypothetical protein VI750_11465 [Pyrinomonadaceae bacterium]|nr:hypothetical protein [Pyrinomonadaceae bacterium]
MAIEAKQHDFEVLADEAIKLLRLELGDLYATLGGQLLAQDHPTRVAGIMSYLSALRSASDAKNLYQALPSGPSLNEWGKGLGIIYEELKRDGMKHFSEISDTVRKAICNEDILRMSDQVTPSAVQVVVMIVSANLRMPKELDPISATLAAILFKIGLRSFSNQNTPVFDESCYRSSEL